MDIRVATWNTQWATPSSDRGPRIAAILDAAEFDVIVVTEGVRGLLPAHGHTVDAGGDWGYGAQPSRRKVIVWSRFPLTLNVIGTGGATRGRFAVATAETPSGPLRVMGVCIPWRDAHVTTGRRDAQAWSEHLDYLERLERILPSLDDEIPTVIAGDFNQRIPRKSQPVRVADRLREVLADWTVHTGGELPNGPHIDHIATRRGLTVESVSDWAASDQLGRLSDHAGVACRLVPGIGAALEADDAVVVDRHVAQKDSDDTTIQKRCGIVTLEPGDRQGDSCVLTRDMRAEIEAVLRSSGDGLSHGATFQLREDGLSDAEIAAERKVSVSATRVFSAVSTCYSRGLCRPVSRWR